MTADHRQPGMCSAYGCPMVVTTRSGGRWYCACHAGKSPALNDQITRELRRLDFIVDSVIDLRKEYSLGDWEAASNRIQARLIAAGRRDLAIGAADCSPHRPGVPIARMWLQRLERILIEATDAAASRSTFVPSVPLRKSIIGPTHASTVHPYADPDRA
ncbi:hypothetical protein WN982_00365 [Paraburkholderia sp. IMGN_8]|uniref:hypothetical protein n=1 Tax=Paraburkholderia sp. IMGN_8 TaxID=3136564 RepID=UPI003101A486